jgi:hypothetical protein
MNADKCERPCFQSALIGVNRRLIGLGGFSAVWGAMVDEPVSVTRLAGIFFVA